VPAAENGNTIRVIAAMRPTEIAEQRTNLVRRTIVPALELPIDPRAEKAARLLVHQVAKVAHRHAHRAEKAAARQTVQAVEAVETKSAITAHREVTMEAAVADTVVAAVEIMRAPAVIAADAAWVAADTVEAAAAVAVWAEADEAAAAEVVGAVVAAEEDVGVNQLDEEKTNENQNQY
jgi:hypothetical protein